MNEAEHPSEADVAATADAREGRALVEARVALCTPEEQAAFWEAVGRCFGGGKPPDMQVDA
ncbi:MULTISPECIES: hypothetical protein [unclassified Methylobacterium]|uniref:hypothetical protein n=1 Tax=unclassified Methylobacterium TaxID=2615210 RepID=UPI0011C20189|nr:MULTISPECIES: hypothetical protein [unclassified Methylobacterium]QEE42569.1 hypothetical protein FVA80_30190 [Methylobacterium sp. WL1]TXN03725.1 hypothetical protein FV242_10515 [Methylobacterium sp. WL64]TXN58160.1 hypothetical protein FV241_08355 [Methylobacterium sp. WL2]